MHSWYFLWIITPMFGSFVLGKSIFDMDIIFSFFSSYSCSFCFSEYRYIYSHLVQVGCNFFVFSSYFTCVPCTNSHNPFTLLFLLFFTFALTSEASIQLFSFSLFIFSDDRWIASHSNPPLGIPYFFRVYSISRFATILMRWRLAFYPLQSAASRTYFVLYVPSG